jgi:DNA-binding CsgD family transcriptional regulator
VALVGRALERALIDEMIADVRAGRSRVLLLRGEIGVGKTSLLEYAAAAEGMTILRSVGVRVESDLPFTGLDQLVRPVLHLTGRLPPPQSAALNVALGLRSGPAVDRFLVAAGALSLLAEAAEDSPLLALVDDVQWLDQPSAEAVGFIARRLGADRIALLITQRDGHTHAVWDGLPYRRVTGLDTAESTALLEVTAGHLAPAVAGRLAERAGGNPLALTEVSAMLTAGQADGSDPLPDPLPIGEQVEELFASRLDALDDQTLMLVLLAAAEEQGELAVLERAAAELGLGLHALQPAERHGLLRADGRHVRFRHPLARSAAYYHQPVAQRRVAHQALATALLQVDADRGAWHLAAATSGVDEVAARALELAGQRAAQRSAFATASAALERAAELSPDRAHALRRKITAAEAAWSAGNTRRAQVLVDQLAEPEQNASQAALLRGRLRYAAGQPAQAFDEFLRALTGGSAPTHRGLTEAIRTAWTTNDLQRLALLRIRLGDSVAGFPEHLLVAVEALLSGRYREAVAAMRRAAEDADRATDVTEFAIGASLAAFTGDIATARRLASNGERRARTLGEVGALPVILNTRGLIDTFDGSFESALSHAHEADRLARDTGQSHYLANTNAVAALVSASRGAAPEFERAHRAAIALAGAGVVSTRALTGWAEGLWFLGQGEVDEACSRLLTLAEPQGHPIFALLSTADLAEAAARSGRRDEAVDRLSALQTWSRGAGTPVAAALAARATGVLDDDAALLEEALGLLEGLDRPFDQARTHLLLGEHLRRDRRRAAARHHLRTAVEDFEGLGAEVWARRARNELAATGESVRRRDRGAAQALTPQEHKIARMVADGITNREVAAQLFLSPRTIDYHLRNVFTKLGITSRAELIRNPP